MYFQNGKKKNRVYYSTSVLNMYIVYISYIYIPLFSCTESQWQETNAGYLAIYRSNTNEKYQQVVTAFSQYQEIDTIPSFPFKERQ